MFSEEIALWAGGPTVTLGSYFIGFRYLFCLLFAVWAASVLRWRRRSSFLAVTLALSGLGWLGFDLPLGRIYGLTEEGGALEELGPAMVVAATGSPSEGELVAERNPFPFWSLSLALLSGFDPGKLLSVYPWVPLAVLVLLSVAVLGASRAIEGDEGDEPSRLAPALAVFFVLFLSAPRLAFLEDGGPLWAQAFWLRPRLGAAFAVGLFALHRFAVARSASGFALAGVVLGVAGWLDPRCLWIGGAGAGLWMLLRWRRGGPAWSAGIGLGVALGTFLAWPSSPPPAAPSVASGFSSFVRDLFSVTLGQGAVFYLGVVGLVWMARQRRGAPLLFFSWVVAAYALWILVSISEAAASALDPVVLRSFLRVLLATAAGFGAHRTLLWLEARRRPGETWPALLRERSAYALGLAALVLLSLPWVFPFWWNPVRMDPTYRESFVPVSRQVLAFGEWIRENTPEDAVFAAAPSYSIWIPPLTGRRVLLGREGTALEASRREAAQARILSSGDPGAIREAAERWAVTHVAAGRLDDVNVTVLETSGALSLAYRQRRWVSVFALR